MILLFVRRRRARELDREIAAAAAEANYQAGRSPPFGDEDDYYNPSDPTNPSSVSYYPSSTGTHGAYNQNPLPPGGAGQWDPYNYASSGAAAGVVGGAAVGGAGPGAYVMRNRSRRASTGTGTSAGVAGVGALRSPPGNNTQYPPGPGGGGGYYDDGRPPMAGGASSGEGSGTLYYSDAHGRGGGGGGQYPQGAGAGGGEGYYDPYGNQDPKGANTYPPSPPAHLQAYPQNQAQQPLHPQQGGGGYDVEDAYGGEEDEYEFDSPHAPHAGEGGVGLGMGVHDPLRQGTTGTYDEDEFGEYGAGAGGGRVLKVANE